MKRVSKSDSDDDTIIIWVSVIMGLILLITLVYVFVIRPGHYRKWFSGYKT